MIVCSSSTTCTDTTTIPFTSITCTVCGCKLIPQELGTYRGRLGERCENCWAISPYLPCRPKGENGGLYIAMSPSTLKKYKNNKKKELE